MCDKICFNPHCLQKHFSSLTIPCLFLQKSDNVYKLLLFLIYLCILMLISDVFVLLSRVVI